MNPQNISTEQLLQYIGQLYVQNQVLQQMLQLKLMESPNGSDIQSSDKPQSVDIGDGAGRNTPKG